MQRFVLSGVGALDFDGTGSVCTEDVEEEGDQQCCVIRLEGFSGTVRLTRAPPPARRFAQPSALPSWLSMVDASTDEPSPAAGPGPGSGTGKKRPSSAVSFSSCTPLPPVEGCGVMTDKKAKYLANDDGPQEATLVTPKQFRLEVATHALRRSGHVAWAVPEMPNTLFVHGGSPSPMGGLVYGDLVVFQLDFEKGIATVARPLIPTVPLTGHSGNYVSMADGKLLVCFGGEGDDESNRLSNEVMIMDTSLDAWFPQATQGKPPTGRLGHTAALLRLVGDKTRTRLVVYGGQRGSTFPHNHHVLDLERQCWASPKCEGKPPKARSQHSCCDIGQNSLLIFGGHDANEVFNDVHLLVAAEKGGHLSWSWEQPSVLGERPSPRSGHASCLIGDGQFFLIRGGSGNRDSWLLNISTWVWTKVPMTGIWRELALDTSAISIPADSLGSSPEATTNGLTAHPADSLGSSPEATTGATATLLASGRVVVFGGRDSSTGQSSDKVYVADESALLSLVVDT